MWGNGARYSHAPINTNDNRINGNANDKESLREEIILIRDRALSKKKLNFTHDSKIQKTVEDFVINSFIKNNN